MFGINLYWLLLIAVSLILGFATQGYIKSKYKRWSKIPNSQGLTGGQAARRMLDAYGLNHVAIEMVGGELTDHFDPKTNKVSLSQQVYSNKSVAALAIASHECGHAVQHARNYVPAAIRTTLVPPVNIASSAWIFVLLIGVFLNQLGFVWLAIGLYAVTIIFQLVTLPVELDASHRALAYIKTSGYIMDTETKGARSVLTAAALTYVAAALISLLQLIYLLGFARR